MALFVVNIGARWWWVIRTTLRPHSPWEGPRKGFCRRQCGPRYRSGRICRRENFVPSPGFLPRTIKPVASHYSTVLFRPPYVAQWWNNADREYRITQRKICSSNTSSICISSVRSSGGCCGQTGDKYKSSTKWYINTQFVPHREHLQSQFQEDLVHLV